MSVCPAVRAAVCSDPSGRTTAPAYRAADAGTAFAGSIDVPEGPDDPHAAAAREIAVKATATSARRDWRRRRASEGGTGIAGDRSGWRGCREALAGGSPSPVLLLQGPSHPANLHRRLHFACF